MARVVGGLTCAELHWIVDCQDYGSYGNTGLTLTTVSNFTPLDFYHQASGDFEYGNADGANETGRAARPQ